MPNVTGGKSNDFLQKQLEMFFSDSENAFLKSVLDVTSASDTKALYTLTLASNKLDPFALYLKPDNLFLFIDQIIDDVQENISGDDTHIAYHHWKNVVFQKDETFDTTYWETPVPDIIFRSVSPVGSLGHVLICIGLSQETWYLSLRDTRGNVYPKTRADLDELQAKAYTYHCLNIAAFPKAFFDDNKVIHDHIENLLGRVLICEYDIQTLEDAVFGYDETDPETEEVTHVPGLVDELPVAQSDIQALQEKMNTVYPRTVGDDSLLSQTYRKALKNQLDIYDLDRQVNGYDEGEEPDVVHTDGMVDEIDDLQTLTASLRQRITANEEHIADIEAYPEYNMTGISPFYLFRRGDYSVSNRAYDPVFFDDITFADASSVAWQHVVEHRMKEMPMRLLKDTQLKAAVDRMVNEANNDNITGNRIELGCCTNTYFIFADTAANWTPSASYTRKEAITLVSFVPTRWQGGAFKPALFFQVLGGHLDGGVAAGDFSGGFCLLDRSETSVPDYHWYRYGDNVNINGMALADVKVQYH